MGSGAPGGDAVATLAVAVAAFFAGEVLDASRDLLEDLWDLFQSVEWGFFTDADQDDVEKLRTSSFTYYVFDCNATLALVILLLTQLLTHIFINLSCSVVVVFFLIFLILLVNAWRLRSQISSRTQRWKQAASRRG